MDPTRVTVNPALIDWALAITDLSVEAQTQLIAKTRWLDQAFTNYLRPTVKQLGEFASRLHVPFGKLLLQQAPVQEDIRLAFRTQGNVPATVDLTVRDVIYEMQRKQAWFKEESGLTLPRLSFIGSSSDQKAADTLMALQSQLKRSHQPSARLLYRDLRTQMAEAGVLTMQKGGAGLGTNRPLAVAELRAFVLLDERAPLIFINQKDSYTARIFSLVHEFVHLLRGSDELLTGTDHDIAEERLINRVTAAFLMPKDVFMTRFDADDLMQVARYFAVSPQAVAIRAQQLGLIQASTELELPEVPAVIKRSGGDPYNNALAYNDPRYMQAMVNAQTNGQILPTKAAGLIGISVKMLPKTVAMFEEREAR